MQLSLMFSGSSFALPINYRPLIHGLIYRALSADSAYSTKLHSANQNEGQNRAFKGFTFSSLQGAYTVSTVAVCLNPSSIWEPRIQEIAVQVSLNGENFTEVAAPAKYQFDAATGNRIRIDFGAAQAAFVKVIFTLNSASRSQGAQAAEICIFQ